MPADIFAIPIHYKVGGFGGKISDTIMLNDPFEEVWHVPEPENKKSSAMGAIASAAVKSTMNKAAAAAAGVQQQAQAQEQDEASIEHITRAPFEDTATIYGGIIEAELRSNDIILGANIGGFWDSAQPKFTKSLKSLTSDDKLEKVKARRDETKEEEKIASDDDKEKLKDEDHLLEKEEEKLKHLKKELEKHNVKEDEIFLHDSITACSGPIFFAGPYLGHYVGENLSVSLLINVAAKKTKIHVIKQERVDPEELIANRDVEEKKEKKEKKHKKDKEGKGDAHEPKFANIDPGNLIITHKTTTDLGICLGVLGGIKIAYNLTDSVQAWAIGAGIWFLDDLSKKAMSEVKNPLNEKGKSREAQSIKKGPVARVHVPKEVDAQNGTKTFIIFGLSVRII